MKKRVESYIPRALEAITAVRINNGNTVDKQFNGYIASFGASIRQAGLLATVLFYQEDSSAEAERHKVIEAIEYIIEAPIRKTATSHETKMKVLDAAAALKLAIRTYAKPDEKEE